MALVEAYVGEGVSRVVHYVATRWMHSGTSHVEWWKLRRVHASQPPRPGYNPCS
jgi:hypothetical protein